jgi:hypothetical protein
VGDAVLREAREEVVREADGGREEICAPGAEGGVGEAVLFQRRG